VARLRLQAHLHGDAHELGDIARAAGFLVTHVVDIHARVIAVLTAGAGSGADR